MKIELEKKAQWVRRQTLELCVRGDTGHLVSSLSCTDILVALYYGGILRYDPIKPKWDVRDRFIMSKGHGGIALYPILADLGYFPEEELENYGQDGCILGGHPDSNIAGIETITGSLGHGLGIAVGMALSGKLDKKDYKVITLLGDGECYEGSIWESANFAGSHELGNLIAVIDRNGISATDFTENYKRLEPLAEKWEVFGWQVECVDGHSFEQLIYAFDVMHEKPLVVIANTIKGKGVSFMENQPMCHSWIPRGEQLELARLELGEK